MVKAEVLIVEDDRIVAKDLQNSLENLGYAVSSIVPSGAEALSMVNEKKPDLVLMDIMLRGEMDGIETATHLHSQFNIPVVYLTAYADNKMLERAKLAEPFGYIIKPFEERELNIAIEIALYKHKMEKKLKESEEWLSTTLSSVGDAVIATDTKGAVTFMNPVAQSLTGWNREEALGKPVKEVFNIINEQTKEQFENPVTEVIRGGKIVGLPGHILLIAHDGTEIPVDDSAAPIRDEKGDMIGVVLVFRDITERKRAELEKIQLEKIGALGRLTGGIAHELNNPMMGMLNFIQYCLKHTPKDGKTYPVLEDTERETKRCIDIVRNLLTFSRIEKENEEEYKKESLSTVFDRVFNLLSYRIEKENILVTQEYPEESPEISMKISNIQQVFLNLIGNALDALRGRKKKEINVEVRPEGEFVRVIIADSGCGIVSENFQNIFDPFFTTKPPGQGTGLGLSVSHSIVKAHGGEITCNSEVGVGTKFSVLLPIGRGA